MINTGKFSNEDAPFNIKQFLTFTSVSSLLFRYQENYEWPAYFVELNFDLRIVEKYLIYSSIQFGDPVQNYVTDLIQIDGGDFFLGLDTFQDQKSGTYWLH